MAQIQDPMISKYCNEELRPLLDIFTTASHRAQRLMERFQSYGIATILASQNGGAGAALTDTINDSSTGTGTSSPQDGRPGPVTVQNLIDQTQVAQNVLGQAMNSLYLLPPLLNPANTSAGGTLAAGVYYYRVTALTPSSGETAGSTESTGVTTTGFQTVNLSWSPLVAAVGYKVYRGTVSGQENVLVATLSAAQTTFADNGGATTSGAPPVISTALLDSVAPIVSMMKLAVNPG